MLRRFDTPIALPSGKTNRNLKDAAQHMLALPKAEQKKPHWQTATGELLTAAERGGILMLAEIAMR